jgi:hypothetical protein
VPDLDTKPGIGLETVIELEIVPEAGLAIEYAIETNAWLGIDAETVPDAEVVPKLGLGCEPMIELEPEPKVGPSFVLNFDIGLEVVPMIEPIVELKFDV